MRLLLSPDTAEQQGIETGEARSEDLGTAQVDSRPDFNAPSASSATSGPVVQGADDAGVAASLPSGLPDPSSNPGQQAANPGGPLSIRDAAAAYGFRGLERFQDDQSAFVHILQQAQRNSQADYYAQIGRQLAPHADKLQGYFQQQAKPQEAPAWQPPEFDERWASLVEQDPATGVYISKQGVPHEIGQKVNAHVEWHKNFSRNPVAVFDAYTQSKFGSVDERVNAILAQRDEQAAVRDIQTQNAEWWYAKDMTGSFARDYQGRPQLTPAGARYAQIVSQVGQAGVRDIRLQDQFARQMLSAEIYAGQTQGNRAPALAQQTANAAARPATNPLQALPVNARESVQGGTEPSNTGLSLGERLRLELEQAGVSDRDVASSLPE